MASASSSTSIPTQPPTSSSYTNHVFLCFSGPDAGDRFANHLYAALERKGIRTFKDDKKLEIGVDFPDELVKAIEESMFAIIIFSPDFASSSWCLDEVCKIMECQNKQKLQMVEVFYGVEPSDVRHQIGTFQKALEKHEQDGFHDSEKIQRWRKALKRVTDINGWTSKKHPDEAVFVENIAQHIFELLIPKLPSSMKNLVGIESRVEQVISQIGFKLNDVRYIGIWGMGGTGKTTIARAVYETIRSAFQVTCFLADVRDQCERKDIVHVQKQLLDQMHIGSTTVYNKYDGTSIIQTSFKLKTVLVVLDDINDEEQLENLAGNQKWFGPGSRIIITTRDIEVLKQQERYETYKVEGLEESEASRLFCLTAFNQSKPKKGFSDFSKEVVKYSGGLPLALKVLGSHLNGRPIEVWHSAIKDIKEFSHFKIIDVLKISYNGLNPRAKDIFLDIACFFKGGEKDEATEILERCGHNVKIGIDILINRSLVTLENWHGRVILSMHDLLEEMAKHIVIDESSNDLSKQSRLWCYKDVHSILNQKKEIEATCHSMVLHGDGEMDEKIELGRRDLSFSNICHLKILILYGVETLILCNIPCTLKVFRWTFCPMKTLPFVDDQHYELVEIDLSYSEIIQLWDGKKFLNKLEHLNLYRCHKLKQTPDLSGAPNLKTLDLEECTELNYIHPSLTDHKSLVELNLRGCSRLKTLGDKLEMSSLKKLDLEECSGLRSVPELGECMKQLSILALELRALELGGILYNTHGLESLTVGYRSKRQSIAGLFHSLSHLTCLTSLALHECFRTSEEPIPYYDLDHLPLLTDLDLSRNSFLRVPINVHKLPRLTRLHLRSCFSLKVLPELPSNLRELHVEGCDSLDAFNMNKVISKACCVFAESATQDREDMLQMWISGNGIPAWFEHQGGDNGVSVSFPHNCPSTETLALALCFLIKKENRCFPQVSATLICNGEEFIDKSLLKMWKTGGIGFMGIVCVNGYYLTKLLPQPNRFELFSPQKVVERCGARWVRKQDIQHFNKTKAEEEEEEYYDIAEHDFRGVASSPSPTMYDSSELEEEEEEYEVFSWT